MALEMNARERSSEINALSILGQKLKSKSDNDFLNGSPAVSVGSRRFFFFFVRFQLPTARKETPDRKGLFQLQKIPWHLIVQPYGQDPAPLAGFGLIQDLTLAASTYSSSERTSTEESMTCLTRPEEPVFQLQLRIRCID